MTSASNSSEVKTGKEHPPRPNSDADLNHLPHRAPPEADYVLHGRQLRPGQATVLLTPQALAEMATHAHSDAEREVGGVLLGRAYRHEGRLYVEVRAALPARSDDHGPVHFTFNADAWSRLHQDRASHYPELDIVGWFHTHPDLGVFYSADDVVVHSAAFVMPWHVGLVIDPVRREAGMFGWQAAADGGRQIVPLPGFYEVVLAEESTFPWRPVRSAVWDKTYEEHLAQRQRRSATAEAGVVTAVPQWPALPPVNPWLGVMAGALGVLLTLFLVVAVVLPLNRRANALESVVVPLAEQQLAAANASGDAACENPTVRILSPLPGQMVPYREVAVVGTAAHPEAARYRLELRPAGAEEWVTLAQFRRDRHRTILAEWETTTYAPGEYELRLLPLDRDRQPLTEFSSCIIRFTLQ